jgi:ABC-type phosphate transport system auxiliary subunit
VDHNGFLRHQFSGDVMAASKEQLDILIGELKAKRELLDDALIALRNNFVNYSYSCLPVITPVSDGVSLYFSCIS